MSRLVFGFSIVMLSVAACGGDDKKDEAQCADAAECVVPWDCAVGQTCDVTTGCCVEFGCVPGECATGTFCDGDTKECTSVGDACLTAANGCECHILNPAGEFEDIRIGVALRAILDVKGFTYVVDADSMVSWPRTR